MHRYQYKIERFGSRFKLTVFLSSRGSLISSDTLISSEDSQKSVNNEKLDNNISRAKSRVLELALCNPWEYFATLTIDAQKQNRYNLKDYIRDLGVWIGNYGKKYSTRLKYLIVPEQHKDGAYHAHALLMGVSRESLVKNQYGYLDMPYYSNRFGYISLDPIRDINRTASYVTKYVTKDFATKREKNEHLFYASQHLSGKEVLHDGVCKGFDVNAFWSNDYVAVCWGDDIQRLFSVVVE